MQQEIAKERAFLENILKKHRKIALWGAGAKAQVIFNLYKGLFDNVELIVDSDWHKEGKYLMNANIPIQRPSDKLKSCDAILILAKSYFNEIKNQLKKDFDYNGEIYQI